MIGVGLLAMLGALAQGELRSAPVERFVALVRSGQDFANSEFSGALSAEDAVALRDVARCEAQPPRFSQDRTSVLILWDCTGQPDARSIGTMLRMDGDRVSMIMVVPAVIVPVRG